MPDSYTSRINADALKALPEQPFEFQMTFSPDHIDPPVAPIRFIAKPLQGFKSIREAAARKIGAYFEIPEVILAVSLGQSAELALGVWLDEQHGGQFADAV